MSHVSTTNPDTRTACPSLSLAEFYQSRAEAIESRRPGWQIFGWVYSIVLLPFAVVGGLRLHRRRRDLGPLLAVIAGVTLLGVLSWGNQRFRLPAEPCVLILAAVGVLAAIEATSRRSRSDGSAPLAG